MPIYRLHNFFRSSTSFRVRAALNLKGVDYEYLAYALRAGEHRQAAHTDLNPQALVPTLETPGGPLSQSLAIIEWLDETLPEPALLPEDAWGRARVRSLAQMIALDIHPVNNLRVLKYLEQGFAADQEQIATWFRHWVDETFKPLEHRLGSEPQTGRFCHGDTISLADLCLAGQVLNNQRFAVDMTPYPKISSIHEACMADPAIAAAAPENQPDAV